MATTVNVIQPDDEYQQVNVNNSLISIWRKQGYDIALARSRRESLDGQFDILSERLKDIQENVNKLKGAAVSLQKIKDLIAAVKKARVKKARV
jgi:hypothetical protein